MALNVTSIKCPECGHALDLNGEEGPKFCAYCGARLAVTNENEYIFHTVDEARIRKEENEHKLRMRELEMQEAARRERGKTAWRVTRIVLWALMSAGILWLSHLWLRDAVPLTRFFRLPVIAATGLPAIIVGGWLVFRHWPDRERQQDLAHAGGVAFPGGLEPFHARRYTSVEKALLAAGFTNVTCINLHDLNPVTVYFRADKVAAVTVDGAYVTAGGRVYPADAKIIISYHGV